MPVEAMSSARKPELDSKSSTVRITAEVSDGELLITITDNGRGFDQSQAFDRGMGLQGMRERARLIGGSLLVMSELSGGTTLEVRAPIATAGVRSAAETTERTTMALDQPAEADEEPLPNTFPGATGGETPDSRPTVVQT